MNKLFAASIISIGLIISCRQLPEQPDLSKIKLDLPSTPYEYNMISTPFGKKPVFYEDSSLIDNKKATIGRVLFYDKALSFNNSTACASCHFQANGFSDVVAFSAGFDGQATKRNSMPISNLFNNRQAGYFWDIRETKIESMVFAPIEDHIEMGFQNIALITEKIGSLKYYQQLFKDCYGDEKITTDRMRESLGHFLFSIVNTNSKFDIGLKTNFSNFSDIEKDGMELFKTNECDKCHFLSPQFSSEGANREKMANVGLDVVDRDPGKEGEYRIPDLRNVSKTGPYMHDGRFKTLNEVIAHYGFSVQKNPRLAKELKDKKPEAAQPSNYSGFRQSNIVAFLKTLDDTYSTTDKKFSSPFVNQ